MKEIGHFVRILPLSLINLTLCIFAIRCAGIGAVWQDKKYIEL